MSEEHDPLRRIIELVDATPRSHTDVSAIHGRVRRRRNRRHAVATVVAGVILAGGVVLATVAPGSQDDLAIGTADVPAAPNTVDTLTADAWRAWDVDGVVDRAGRAAPVYRRSGSGDGLVVVLGPSVPCIDRATCGIERSRLPNDLGFLSGRGPLGDEPAVFIPSWNDDLHVGRSTDVHLDGLDSPQQFVGARNVERVVRAVALERADSPPDRIVIAGTGGGGVGAMVHAETLSAAFPGTPVVALVDGMVVPGRDTFDDCILRAAQTAWGAPVPAAGATAATVQANLARATPAARFVVIVHRDDPVLRRLPILPGSGCDPTTGPMPVADYQRAVDAMDEDATRWRVVIVESAGHSVLDRPDDHPATDRVLDALDQGR